MITTTESTPAGFERRPWPSKEDARGYLTTRARTLHAENTQWYFLNAHEDGVTWLTIVQGNRHNERTTD